MGEGKAVGRFYFWITMCGLFLLLGYFQLVKESEEHSLELSSNLETTYEENFETAQSCSAEKSYHLPEIQKIKSLFSAKSSLDFQGYADVPSRSCVTYIMSSMNKILSNKSIAQCSQENSEPHRGDPTQPAMNPCLTEEYVNLIYQALVDVTDCFHIPVKELLPKLYNESGLHFNTLGPDADAGVGQMTKQAIMESFVYMNGDSKNPMAFDFYLNEVKKSPRASCQRVATFEKYLRMNPQPGQVICSVTQVQAEAQLPEEEKKCYVAWSGKNRCNMVALPDNPLRNIFYTAIFYRSMLKNAAGVSFEKGGTDILTLKDGSKIPMTSEKNYRGYFESLRVHDRLKALGLNEFNQEALKSMFISFGFNGGIEKGAILFDVYLKAREAVSLNLQSSDFDFRNVARNTRWGTLVNPGALFKALKMTAEDEQRYLKVVDLMKSEGLSVDEFLKQYKELKNSVTHDESATETKKFLEKYALKRVALLQTVLDQAHVLSFPEFLVLSHAAYTDRNGRSFGGAPGYLNFIMKRQLELENVFGENSCTSSDYLKF